MANPFDTASANLIAVTTRLTSLGAVVLDASANDRVPDDALISWARAAGPTLGQIERDLAALERRLRRHMPAPETAA